ncbi:hypothetical protein [Cellvibrio sp. NN19]|uniref:hypothetical protein n=1 Tax=Cellvibrio chitinivorans TaxID=3102792 RepID=UPI002B4090BB|nr:hypothetical protein [Cellvibrio sp. NN19]
MIEIAGKVFEVLQSGNVLWFAVFLIVAFVMNASKIFDFLESRKKKQIKRLQEALSCNLLDENFRNFISQELHREYFLYITNIAGEKQYRDRLFQIHRDSNGRLPFFHFRRASGSVKFVDGNVMVKLGFFDKLSYWYNIAAGIFFLFVSWAFLMMPILTKSLSVVQVAVYIGAGLMFLFVALLFGAQTFPYSSAIKVQAEISRQENNENCLPKQ